MPSCAVCGSSAPVVRADLARHVTLDLCYAHEYVCSDHLADPCAVCDAS